MNEAGGTAVKTLARSWPSERALMKSSDALLADDLRLPRAAVDPEKFASLSVIANSLVVSAPDLVYTAFDGDHFALTSVMKQCVLDHGLVPADPESIIGYRDSVLAHMTKRGVLLDDLSIVRKCDSLWVFTDVSADPGSVAGGLAEGALVELLWFLRAGGSHARRSVRFVSVRSLLAGEFESCMYRYSYAETRAALASDQAGIATLLDDVEIDLAQPRKVLALLHDPLDSKYVNWLRALTHTVRNRVPLVLQLAIKVSDTARREEVAPGRHPERPSALACWISLLKLADELLVLPASEPGRKDSYVVETIKSAWSTSFAELPMKADWREFEVPKSILGAAWSITARERAFL